MQGSHMIRRAMTSRRWPKSQNRQIPLLKKVRGACPVIQRSVPRHPPQPRPQGPFENEIQNILLNWNKSRGTIQPSGRWSWRGTESEQPPRQITPQSCPWNSGNRRLRKRRSEDVPKSSKSKKKWSINSKCLTILKLKNSTHWTSSSPYIWVKEHKMSHTRSSCKRSMIDWMKRDMDQRVNLAMKTVVIIIVINLLHKEKIWKEKKLRFGASKISSKIETTWLVKLNMRGMRLKEAMQGSKRSVTNWRGAMSTKSKLCML